MARHGSRTPARRHPLAVTSLVSGLAHRGASTLLIFIVALVACAAASTGPAYYASAQTSIVRDTFATAPLVERGFEVAVQGQVPGQVGAVSGLVNRVVAATVPDPAVRKRLFAAPILATEASVYDPAIPSSIPLVWRSDECAHLHLTTGRCPQTTGEVLVSSSLAADQHLRAGQRLRFAGWPALTVVGVYGIPNWNADYWFNRGSVYFKNEDRFSSGVNAPLTRVASHSVAWARSRSLTGSQVVKTRVRFGKAPASPAPNNARIATRDEPFQAQPVAAVNSDHQMTIRMSTRRGPIRSPSQPPGISKIA